MLSAIVTIPPYADFLAHVARHPIVSGLRLNTVMPLKETHSEVLKRLSGLGQALWVDLKGRQLRVVGAAIPPYTEVQLSHPIEIDTSGDTPVDAFFSDGRESSRIIGVTGAKNDRIILEDGPRRLIGPGESVNIVHPSLKIGGTLTETDRRYLEAMAELGLERVMLSFVETPSDIDEVREILPNAEIVLKIESLRGLDFARQHKATLGRLMAARGDLFVEVERPHHIIRATRTIINSDPDAIAASRILESFADHPVPECADIGDLAFLMMSGYQTLMLGDRVCLQRDTVIEALNLLSAVAKDL